MFSKSKKPSVGGDVLYLTASRVLVAMIGFVTSMLLARFRTLEEFGTYSQIIMVTDLFSTILLLGLPNSINYFLAKADNDKEKQRFLSVYFTLNTILTVIIGISLIFSLPLIINYFNNPLITGFAYIFAIYPWSSLVTNSLGNICIIYGKANKLVVFNIIHALVTLFILLLAKVCKLSFSEYMIAYMMTMLLFSIFAILWIKRMSGALQIKIDWKLIKQIFVFSIPMGLASVVGTLNTELGKLVIGGFYPTEEYAIFANASKELPVTFIATSITAVLLPKMVKMISENKNREATELWGSSINLSLCFMCLIVGGLIVFAPDVMSLFYSEKYVTTDGVAVFRISSLILLFRSTYWGIILNATGKTKFVLYSSTLTLVLNFVGNLLLCNIFGIIGPAISNLIVTVVMVFVQLIFTSRAIAVPIQNIFKWKDVLYLLSQMIIFIVCFAFLKNVIGNYERNVSIIISIGLGLVWTLIYGLINMKFIKKNWTALNR